MLGQLRDAGNAATSAVGAYLIGRSGKEGFEVYWWCEGAKEVDFVISDGDRLAAIEVKSGRRKS